MHRSDTAVQTATSTRPGKASFQNNYSMPWQTINELTNGYHEICVFPYGTCLPIKQLCIQRDGYKLPVRAWWCRTGHKNSHTSLKQKKTQPKQPWSTFRYRTPVRAFKKIFTDKRVAEVSGQQRSGEGPCSEAPSSSVTDRTESPLKPEEASPLTSLGPG